MVPGEFVDRHQLSGDPIARHLVDLCDHNHQRGPGSHIADLLEDPPVPRSDRLIGGNAPPDHVDVAVGVAHQIVEPLPEQGARTVQPRGVDKDDLKVLPVHDAADGVPRGLRAVGGDRPLLPHQGIGQRGLTGVGPTDETHESRAEFAHFSAPIGSSSALARRTSTVLIRCRPR